MVFEEQAGELIDDLCHELRTPLAVINCVLDNISLNLRKKRNGKQNCSGCIKFIRVARHNTLHAVEIINQILKSHRTQSKRLQPARKKIIIRQFLADVFFGLGNAFRRKNVILRRDVDPRIRWVYADPVFLKQILVNLLTNAIKFSPANARVLVKINKKTKRINGHVKRFVQVSVHDNGVGIAPIHIGRIFVRGSGPAGKVLGLSIVRSLVECHNGKIWVKSREGKGSEFSFILPEA
ncbi:MAG: HAMP domain-containing histidine kinase [Elusimicrobia bacterium]|nr:HAMP domain-containing histidine kinase [Elusimicrobiota bacterium]